jgi:hypothetical protein
MDQLTALINNWIGLAQGIVGSVGALALAIVKLAYLAGWPGIQTVILP